MKRPSPDWPASSGDNGYPGFSPFSDPGAQLRARVDQRTLRVKGRTTVRGRTAYRLVSKPRRDPQQGSCEKPSPTWWTRAPICRSRSAISTLGDFGNVDPALGGRELIRWRAEYLRYERLPLTDENRALLRMGRHPGTRIHGP